MASRTARVSARQSAVSGLSPAGNQRSSARSMLPAKSSYAVSRRARTAAASSAVRAATELTHVRVRTRPGSVAASCCAMSEPRENPTRWTGPAGMRAAMSAAMSSRVVAAVSGGCSPCPGRSRATVGRSRRSSTRAHTVRSRPTPWRSTTGVPASSAVIAPTTCPPRAGRAAPAAVRPWHRRARRGSRRRAGHRRRAIRRSGGASGSSHP